MHTHRAVFWFKVLQTSPIAVNFGKSPNVDRSLRYIRTENPERNRVRCRLALRMGYQPCDKYGHLPSLILTYTISHTGQQFTMIDKWSLSIYISALAYLAVCYFVILCRRLLPSPEPCISLNIWFLRRARITNGTLAQNNGRWRINFTNDY